MSVVMEFEQELPENERAKAPEGTRVRKKQCCFYCKKYFSNIAQHLERKHSTEDEVREILVLPKGSYERKKIFEVIRKKGNFDSAVINNKVIPIRQSRKEENYKFCPSCKGVYCKESLRKHYKKCSNQSRANNRGLMILSRRVFNGLHPTASKDLTVVFSRMNDKDNVVRIIKWDTLVISYGNKLCSKLKDPHHYPEIRAKLRLLGRFLMKMREKSIEIQDFASIYKPENYKYALEVVNYLAGLREETRTFRNPAVATSLGTILKKVGKHLKSFYIQHNGKAKIPKVEDFLHLLQEDYSTSINKTATETFLEMRRSKNIELPSHQDIEKLYNHVCSLRNDMYKEIKEKGFTLQSWINLSESTLISLMVFNRRRTGESDKLKIDDLQNYQTIDCDKDKDIYMTLDFAEKNAARNYGLIRLRGKLGREVNVVVDKQTYKSLQMIIKYRVEAGVLPSNPYIFGLKSEDNVEHKHLKACDLMRKFSEECHADNPKLLRGTLLRKHMATQAAMLGLAETEVTDLANHLGHAEKIHKNYYRLPVATREITQMSRLLTTCINPTKNEQITQTHTGVDTTVEDPNAEDNFCVSPSPDFSPLSEREWDEASSTEEISSHEIGQQLPQCLKGRKELKVVITPMKLTQVSELPSTPTSRDLFDATSDAYNSSSDEWTPKKYSRRVSYTFSSDDDIELKEENTKTKITTSKTKRITWSTPEKKVAKQLFKEYLDKNILPPFKLVRDAVRQYPDLQRRTAKQLYAWLNNLNKRNSGKCINSRKNKSGIKRNPWTTPEKYIVRKAFGNYIKSGRLPPFKQCQQTVESCQGLKGRSAEMLYAYINNVINKNKNNPASPLDKYHLDMGTPKKQIVRRLFTNHIEEGRVPSNIECPQVIVDNLALRTMSVEKVGNIVEFEIKRNQFKKKF